VDQDDRPVGRILSRREIIASLGVAGAAALGGGLLLPRRASARAMRAGWPACVVRPAQTEGPYFLDERLDRTDIRSDPTDGSVKAGAPLDLTFNVSRLDGATCAPLAGAYVDLWQCDAEGVYAGVTDINGLFDTRGKKFLRGYQVTNAAGVARFRTIYPGWYQGRAVHVHFKIRTDLTARAREFASQLYFDEAVNDRVMARPPYNTKPGSRQPNARDGIFRSSGGSQLVMALAEAGGGWSGSFDSGLAL